MRLLVQQGMVSLRDIPPIPLEIPPDQYSDQQRELLAALNVIQNLDTIRVAQVVRQLGLVSV
ncbi:MAG: hypothetical protein VX506_02760, partial [Pseudomonadota bacterium]|nr:hypothetical protein [Pseudomonadota bacterium]